MCRGADPVHGPGHQRGKEASENEDLLINLQTRVSERLGCQAHARAHVQCFRNNTLTNVSPNFVQFAGNDGMSRQESEKAFING